MSPDGRITKHNRHVLMASVRKMPCHLMLIPPLGNANNTQTEGVSSKSSALVQQRVLSMFELLLHSNSTVNKMH